MDDSRFLRSIGRRSIAAALFAVGLASTPVLQAQTQDLMATLPSAADSRKLAATTCASCHGAEGEGNAAAGYPRLAGTGAAYLLGQLDAFASGYRKHAVMQPIAQGLSEQQRIELAQLYASLPSPVKLDRPVHLDAEPSNKGEWLALRGRWADDIPPCGHCHGPTGLGIGEHFPPLAGQPAAYLEAQLNGWKDGLRPPGPMALMVLIASRLDRADIAAVARYYAELPSAGGGARPTGGAQ